MGCYFRVVSNCFVACQVVRRIIRGAEDLDLEFFKNARYRVLGLGQLPVGFIPDF